MGKIDPLTFLSKRYSGRKPSAIRKIVSDNMGVPGMLSLAGGLPNPKVFPISGMSIKLTDGSELSVGADSVAEGLQYSASQGMPRLVKQLKEMQLRVHSPPTEVEVVVGTGSQSLLTQTFDMLLNPGDSLLVEAPTYPGSLAALQPIRPSYAPIPTDAQGIIPSALREILDTWDESQSPKPRVLYTIPTGQNPSGSTIPSDRKVEIYAIAQQHNILIMEDDPYYYLYLGKKGDLTRTPPKSFMSMDVDGRVLRFDSMSKVLSSGMRLGFMTARKEFTEPIIKDIGGTSLHTSNISQMMAAELLGKWGEEGWENHIKTVKDFYSQRRDKFIEYCEKHLTGLAEWDYPEAGMFVWFRFLHVADTMELIMEKAKKERVLLVPGQSFFTDGKPSNCVRASFSLVSDEEMDEALSRLAKLLRENADK
eukprot:TRINITY_DN13082_c0_g2_i1.p1 TRINITY_DN13082_c0_g2~~TRINITY_DN13082_c0_g2_i1.p1  ORF type:complete len:438 (+),score=109.91 TRINITY_DN13082_c0_g2_i1:51-1316(+)